jgi:hypothetical protein
LEVFDLFLETRYFVAFPTGKYGGFSDFHQCLWVILEILNNLRFFQIFEIKEPSVLPFWGGGGCFRHSFLVFKQPQITGISHEMPVCQKKYLF